MLRHRIGPLAVLVVPTLLTAQRASCPTTPADTAALAPSDVERPPVADSANLAPRYPELLRQAGIGGLVRVTFVVDTGGRPERATIAIVQSAHVGFDFPVKNVVASWRYAPARACGRTVRVRLVHEFAFELGPRDSSRVAALFERDTTPPAARKTTSQGTPRWYIGSSRAIESPPPAPWAPAVLDSATEAALAYLVEQIGPDSAGTARVVCLSGDSASKRDPDARRLARLTRPGITVLPARRCPPTFASMIYTAGEPPAPPGDDPYSIVVRSERPLTLARVVLAVDVLHGTGGSNYLCGVERREGNWRVRCWITSSWAS